MFVRKVLQKIRAHLKTKFALDDHVLPGWHYCPYKHPDGKYYSVCELYPDIDRGHGWTGPIKPGGETVDELIRDLEMMLSDLRKSKEDGRMVVATGEDDGYVKGI